MGKLIVFNFVTLNGFFEGPTKGDITWHRHGGEENEYSAEMLKKDSILLFGRVTYQLMANYWPTPAAMKDNPIVAEGMNKAEKIVFSRTLRKPEWQNTKIIRDRIEEGVMKLKRSQSKDMALLGSGSIATKFAGSGLIDEYQIMIDPVVLGNGIPIFKGIRHKLDLKLTSSKVFQSGVVLLCYEPLIKSVA